MWQTILKPFKKLWTHLCGISSSDAIDPARVAPPRIYRWNPFVPEKTMFLWVARENEILVGHDYKIGRVYEKHVFSVDPPGVPMDSYRFFFHNSRFSEYEPGYLYTAEDHSLIV
jgi:hypothetical protein